VAYAYQSESFYDSSGLAADGAAGAYIWDATANEFTINTPNPNNTASPLVYTITFTFLSGAPDPSRLLLVADGFGGAGPYTEGTFAMVSQAGKLVGQNDYGTGGSNTWATMCLDTAYSSSATACRTAGTLLYSGYSLSKVPSVWELGDANNTGWALFQPTAALLKSGIPKRPTLSVNVSQAGGDGIGFTLGYAGSGYIEVCKSNSTTNPVPASGIYSFAVQGSQYTTKNPLTVPVGECSAPIPVTAGTPQIQELPTPGVAANNITALGFNPANFTEESLLADPPDTQTGTASIIVQPSEPGDTSLQTIVDYTNQEAPPAVLKLCKVAANGSTGIVGKSFNFTVTPTGGPATKLSILAGPYSQGGYCQVVPGTFQVGTSVNITESVPAGYATPSITVDGASVSSSGCPPVFAGTAFSCTVAAVIGPDVNEVSFTNSPAVANSPLTGGGGTDLPALAIANYSLVHQVATQGKRSYMTYRADLLNAGTTNVGPITASATSLDASALQVVGQGTLTFAGAPANGQVTSRKTFTILTDPNLPPDFSKLKWTIQSTRSIKPEPVQ